MSTGIYNVLLGRFGNKLFQYCYARALAEREGLELVTPEWEGQKIFQIEPTRSRQAGDREVGGYCQNQESLIYTRKQAREWFKFRPEVEATLHKFVPVGAACGHRRVGDYPGYSFPVVSEKSYRDAEQQYGLPPLVMVTEENPMLPGLFPETPWLPDFYRLMKAPILLRGNSTFSWWTSTLGNGVTYSPVIDDLEGGREHDCAFVLGNHKKFANLAFVSDLHLPE